MRKKKTTSLWKYIVPAVLLHLAILLLPGHVYEVFFPSTSPEDSGPPSDLMPDFEQYAIHVVYIDDEEPQVEIVTNPAVEVAPPAGEGVTTGEEPGSGGDEGLLVVPEPRFYPPVPRLIVPPSVQNLDLADLTVTLRILVDREGRPMEVVIVNAPENRVVYDRVMEAAREFRFRPARRGTEPVEAWIELPLNLETTRRD